LRIIYELNQMLVNYLVAREGLGPTTQKIATKTIK
jgi:hypothetical protein